jgi:hypothetical protein
MIRGLRQEAKHGKKSASSGDVPAFQTLDHDGELLFRTSLIEKDETEYGQYFAKYWQRIEDQNHSLQVKVLDDPRHYFFLQRPKTVVEMIVQFGQSCPSPKSKNTRMIQGFVTI